MDDLAPRSALTAQDAAEALIAIGWPVEPDDDFEAWRLGDFILTDDELTSLAARHGFVPASERLQ
jgi:hypothetical protein